jgi:hypothetical protein
MIFVTKGMKVLTSQQLDNRTQSYIDNEWPQWKRERSIRKADGLFDTYMDGVEADTDINRANNEFNWQLEQFQKATKRLEQYELSVGVPESSREVPVGEPRFDETTGEIGYETKTVVTEAIPPLESTITVVTYDDGGEEVSSEEVANPEVVQDEEERAQAQSIIDRTPDAVYEFLGLEIPTEEEEETEDGED